jgi:hypothetical protein
MVIMNNKMIKLWTCPECGRQFERVGQAHSCRVFPLAEHFKGKPAGKLLYEKLKSGLKKQIGSFKIESLECCIHFRTVSTFAAVRIYKNKIKLDFASNHKIESSRLHQFVQFSANRYLYYIDIYCQEDIDEELMKKKAIY